MSARGEQRRGPQKEPATGLVAFSYKSNRLSDFEVVPSEGAESERAQRRGALPRGTSAFHRALKPGPKLFASQSSHALTSHTGKEVNLRPREEPTVSNEI